MKASKKVLPLLLTAIMVFAMLPVTARAESPVWDGTADTSWYNAAETAFAITSAEQLAGLAALVNSGESFAGKAVTLGADIFLNDTSNWTSWAGSAPAHSWTAIGSNPMPFSGTFDGQGHTVRGIYINNRFVSYQGLFGCVGIGGIVRNLGVENSYIKGADYVGGMAGFNMGGTIVNCHNTGTVSGINYIGGLAGHHHNGTIVNSYNTGSVNGINLVGGVAGRSNFYAFIHNSYNTGIVSGAEYTGGVAGANSNASTITESFSTGTVGGTNRVGGVTGDSYNSTISSCYNTGPVNGVDIVGGIAGYKRYGTIINSRNSGSVTGSTCVGGVTGANESGSIANNLNTGPVSGNTLVGGVAGLNLSAIEKSCNTGTVAGNSDAGGVAGGGTGTATSCYYLAGAAVADGGGTAKTTSEFASGEVAWLLQNAQGSGAGLVWGQTAIGGTEIPCLAALTGAAKKVVRVQFYNDEAHRNTFDLHSTAYTLAGSTLALPVIASSYVLRWMDGSSNVYTDATAFSADTDLYTHWFNAPAITTATLPGGRAGTPYNQILTATGDAPITWSLQSGSLPDGLTLSSDGTVSGTPATAGTFDFTVKAASSFGEDTQALRIVIRARSGGAPVFAPRTLSNPAAGITVSGSLDPNAVLTVTEPALHPEGDAACDAMRAARTNGQLILGFDIALSHSFTGTLALTIPVGTQYNGQTVTILHCKNGILESLTATVVNGQAVFTVTSLSPFAVVADAANAPEPIPQTGDRQSNLIWWLLCGVAAALLGIKKLCRK